MASLEEAIHVLHSRYRVPHVVITSVSLEHPDHPPRSLSVVGSSMTSAGEPRAFKIIFPAFDCYFSGTGDMFAALMVVRMREAVIATPGLSKSASWLSADDVPALELPLARAAEKVLSSMHEVLFKTCLHLAAERRRIQEEAAQLVNGESGKSEMEAKKLHLLESRAAELRLVRDVQNLRAPNTEFTAEKI